MRCGSWAVGCGSFRADTNERVPLREFQRGDGPELVYPGGRGQSRGGPAWRPGGGKGQRAARPQRGGGMPSGRAGGFIPRVATGLADKDRRPSAVSGRADGPTAPQQSCTSTLGRNESSIGPPSLKLPSRASLLRVGFIARRKFGLPAARVARTLAKLFSIIASVCAFRPDVPVPLRPRELLSDILSSEWDDESDHTSPTPPSQARRALFAVEAPWKPLQNVGACQITPEELRSAFDPLRPNIAPSGTLRRPSPSPASKPMRDFLRDMLSLRIAEELDPARHPATCRVSIIPKNALQSRAICNARFLNQRQPFLPARFRLPSVQQLKELLLTGPLYFCALDVSSCYQSMRLPDDTSTPPFVFHVRDPERGTRAFRLLHLPFGWNASPVVCQRRTTAAIDPPVRRVGAWFLVYLDDALIFSRHFEDAERAAHAAAQGLRQHSLIPHPVKSCLSPATEIAWTGK
eukprot:gene17965-biopygen11563